MTNAECGRSNRAHKTITVKPDRLFIASNEGQKMVMQEMTVAAS